jgi:Tfp pilus assembly protein PilF
MKKAAILLIMISYVALTNAQNLKVQSAFNYYNNKQLNRAKEAIDPACVHEDTKSDAKTWFYKGNIYLDIYLLNQMTVDLKKGMSKEEVKKIKVLSIPNSERKAKPSKNRLERWAYDYDLFLYFDDNGKLSSWDEPEGGIYKTIGKNTDLLNDGYDALQKTISLDKDKQYYKICMLKLFICGEQFYNKGVKQYNQHLHKQAINSFEKTVKINKIFGKIDTLATYNVAVCAELSKQPKKAKKYYLNLVKENFKQPSVYVSLSNIYKSEKDTVRALKIIQKGRKLLPGNLNLIISETNIYLASGQTEKAQESLKLAIEKAPDNVNLYFAIGANYNDIYNDTTKTEKERQIAFKEAEQAYKNAVNKKDDYFDAIYNLGALYFNEGVRIIQIANKLPFDDPNYPKKKEKADNYFQKSLPYLEKALKLNPDDRNTLLSLKQLYARTKQYDKLKEINQKLK